MSEIALTFTKDAFKKKKKKDASFSQSVLPKIDILKEEKCYFL